MKKVEIYKLQNDGSQIVVATCQLSKDGLVECQGDQTLIENLEQDGILDYSLPERPVLQLKDGLRFLEQLSYNFSSPYLAASAIIDSD